MDENDSPVESWNVYLGRCCWLAWFKHSKKKTWLKDDLDVNEKFNHMLFFLASYRNVLSCGNGAIDWSLQFALWVVKSSELYEYEGRENGTREGMNGESESEVEKGSWGRGGGRKREKTGDQDSEWERNEKNIQMRKKNQLDEEKSREIAIRMISILNKNLLWRERHNWLTKRKYFETLINNIPYKIISDNKNQSLSFFKPLQTTRWGSKAAQQQQKTWTS